MSIIEEIAAERQRQITEEGNTREHDDLHDKGQIAAAAATYVLYSYMGKGLCVAGYWPWEREAWKPKNSDRDLIRAAALIVAEIERRRRALAATGPAKTEVEG